MGILNPLASAKTYCEAENEPPKLRTVETFEQKTYRKFKEQPLVPLGCAATVYFLASGIKSFQDRDPIKSQRMMKYRVAAQFVTLLCFVGYMGYDKMDLRVAPMYQEAKKARKLAEQQQQEEGSEAS